MMNNIPKSTRVVHNFRVFLVRFEFAGVGDNGDLTFAEEQKHWIKNINETKISVDASKTRAGGRPAVLFHDPHLPLTSRPVAKLLLACTGIFGSSTAGKCVPPHFQLPTRLTRQMLATGKPHHLPYPCIDNI
jgi:hypothetical protein